MTRDGEIAVLREHLMAIDRLERSLTTVRRRVGALMPMTADRIGSIDTDQHIDVLAFLKTYEQFEDTLGRTLKTIALLMQLGKAERMQPRDVALRSVALGVIPDARRWADAVRTRNELAHQYPLRPDKQSNQINDAWDRSPVLFETAGQIRDFVERERLLHGDL